MTKPIMLDRFIADLQRLRSHARADVPVVLIIDGVQRSERVEAWFMATQHAGGPTICIGDDPR